MFYIILFKKKIFNCFRFVLRECKFPATKIKLTESSLFLTYDTKGYDWTVRLWDFVKGILVASYTCPSMIISCDINSGGDTVIVGLYDFDELVVLRLYNMEKMIMSESAAAGSSPSKSPPLSSEVPIYGDKGLSGMHFEFDI